MTSSQTNTHSLPDPGGPYSPSVRRGSMVFAAGQCGYLPDRTLVSGFEPQARLALENLRAALAKSGASMNDVVSVNVFLSDPDHFAEMNIVYREFFNQEPLPARTTISAVLRPGVLFEANAQAIIS